MLCPNCNNEIGEENSTCKFCEENAKLEEIKTEEVSKPIEEKKVEPTKEVPNTNESRRSILTVVGVAVVLLIMLVVACKVFVFSKDAEGMFKEYINKGIKSLAVPKEFNSIDVGVSLGFETDIEELEVLSGMNLSMNTQFDKKKEEAAVKLNINGKEDKLLNIEGILKDKKLYIKEESIFSKFLEITLTDEQIESINEIFLSEDLTFSQKANMKKATEQLNIEINKRLKKEYFKSENTKITIDGKEVSVKDNTLTLTIEEMGKILEDTLNSLKYNEKFLACYESEEEVKANLDMLIDYAESMYYSYGEEKITIHIYTKGLTSSFKGIAIEVEDGDNKALISILKKNNKNYVIECKAISGEEEIKLFSGNIEVIKNNVNKVEAKIEINITDMGKITLNVASEVKYNKGVNKPDVTSYVNIEDLTDDEFDEIYENVYDNPIFEQFSDYFMGSGYDDYDDDIVYTKDTKMSLKDYYDENEVEYTVPAGYRCYGQSDGYALYTIEKGDDYIDVDVDIEYGDVEENIAYKKGYVDNYSSYDSYKDVNVTDVTTKTVNGKEYKTFTLSYVYESGYGSYKTTYKEHYYFLEINDEYTYVVEINTTNDVSISEQDLNKFLDVVIK